MRARGNKFSARRTECRQGHMHASALEARRCNDLTLLERAGEIRQLEQQPKFPVEINGRKLFRYTADFAYFARNLRVVEDAKGFKTRDYKLRKAIVEAIYNVEIVEVSA